MPRITRAALRSKELVEESNIAASTPLPVTPIKDRVPLGEISDNKAASQNMMITAEDIAEDIAELSKDGPTKGKKGRLGRKAKQAKSKSKEVEIEVLEDDNQSSTSSAVEEACEHLKDNKSSDDHRTVLEDDTPCTPSSAATRVKEQSLYPAMATPKLNTEIHKSISASTLEAKGEDEASSVAATETCAPGSIASSHDTHGEQQINGAMEEAEKDSFVEQIKTRTPGKRVSRIEDSVEALDNLEDEIEKVVELIPATTVGINSPVNAEKQRENQSKPSMQDTNTAVKTKKTTVVPARVPAAKAGRNPPPRASRPSTKPNPKNVRQSTLHVPSPQSTALDGSSDEQAKVSSSLHTAPSKRVSSIHKAPFKPAKSTKAPTRPSFELSGEAIARRLKEKREERLRNYAEEKPKARADLPPIKSSKPLTRPNFELPGEAISRKFKEQREERSKREEEEKPRPTAFKARPIRLSRAPEVKLTAAAKARMSMAKQGSTETSKTAGGVGKSNPSGATSSVTHKRQSSLTVARSSQTEPPTTQPSGTTSRNRISSINSSTISRAPGMVGVPRSPPTASDLAHQKFKGKEVFGRMKTEIKERERARKEKEEAAKKARAEAAERGRIASREWAERQKARKNSEAKEAKDVHGEKAIAASG